MPCKKIISLNIQTSKERTKNEPNGPPLLLIRQSKRSENQNFNHVKGNDLTLKPELFDIIPVVNVIDPLCLRGKHAYAELRRLI